MKYPKYLCGLALVFLGWVAIGCSSGDNPKNGVPILPGDYTHSPGDSRKK